MRSGWFRVSQRTGPTSSTRTKDDLFIAETIPGSIPSAGLPCRPVGFNPFRQQEKTTTDLIIVAVFVVIIIVVVLWALVGG